MQQWLGDSNIEPRGINQGAAFLHIREGEALHEIGDRAGWFQSPAIEIESAVTAVQRRGLYHRESAAVQVHESGGAGSARNIDVSAGREYAGAAYIHPARAVIAGIN